MLSKLYVGTYHGNELTHDSLGSVRPQSSHLSELLWPNSGLKSEIDVRELISIKIV